MQWITIEDMPHAHAEDLLNENGRVVALRISEQNQGGPPPLRLVHFVLEILTPNGWVKIHHVPTLMDPRNEDGNNRRRLECQKQLQKYAAYLYEGDLKPVL
jgi:hypothetical protein